MTPSKTVAVVYHQFPHYRAPVLRELAQSANFNFEFWASTKDFHGIKAFQGDDLVSIKELEVYATKIGFSMKGISRIIFDRRIDSIIVIGNPNIIATWVLAICSRLLQKKVVFWTHGWLRPESFFKTLIRNSYFRLAHLTMVYGKRSEALGKSTGFPGNRIITIFNSLNYEESSSIFQAIESRRPGYDLNPRLLFAEPNLPLLICTARLTSLCKFELLFNAVRSLQNDHFPCNVILIGDGPERKRLEALAIALGVSVHFFGACYDEKTLGQLIYHSDLTVSPGKIGLTAMHSLSYGTPAITHGNFNHQMPEAEAISPSITGDFFTEDDSEDLAFTIRRWISTKTNRALIREQCRRTIETTWNPKTQCERIEFALNQCARSAE